MPIHDNRSYVRGTVGVIANTIMLVCLAAALWGIGAEAFCLTVFFLVWMMRIGLSVGTHWLELEPDTIIYFAPWVREGN